MKCLDTTFLIDFLHNDEAAVKKASEIEEEIIATTALNVFEFLFGVHKNDKGNNMELELFQNFISHIEVLPLDFDSVFYAAKIAANLRKKGKEINLGDSLIAGILMANNCDAIITRDVEHFKKIKGIRVESY